MEGTYGNVFPANRAMSPSITPSNNERYKVNVSRQKTKKWANFKPQNYDGDDWGADDDGLDDEPEPPPPPKPMGPRHPGAHAPTARQFQHGDPSPLPSQLQQYPVAASAGSGQPEADSGPSSRPSGPERSATAPLASPQPSMLETAVAAEPNKPAYAHPPLSLFPKQSSPTSKSPVSPFPPGNSSMGPNDAADTVEAIRKSGPDPRSNDNSQPRLETRSTTFPQSAGPATSQTKPPRFVRPADLYRRMEEERGKERRPSESGSPGADDALGRSGPLQGVPQNQRAGAIAAEFPDTGRGPWPSSGLTQVAERKSEYEIEGLLDSYGSEEPNAGPATTQNPTKSVPATHKDLRRLSTSPKLPDLTRMSGFGVDLFASSSFFPATKLQSPLSDNVQPLMSNQGAAVPESVAVGGPLGQSLATGTPQSVASDPAADANAQSKAPRHDSSTSTAADAAPSPPNEPDRSIGLPLHDGVSSSVHSAVVASEQQSPAADAPQEVTSCEGQQPATAAIRPCIPGGWVTETATPLPTPSQEVLDEVIKSQDAPSGTETDAQPALDSLNLDKPRQSEPEAGPAKEETSLTAHSASPHALPALRTPSPALSTSLDMSSQQATPEVNGRDVSPSKMETAESGSPIPASAGSQHSEITPTAPLNTRRDTPNSEVGTVVSPLVSAPSFGAATLDTSSNSPMKDSDVLSDEIIKSLSPMQSFVGPTEVAEGAEGLTAAYHAASDSMRESSYLGDVYGDYWAATDDDKAEPGPLTMGRTDEPEKSTQASSSLPIEAPKEVPAASSGLGASASPSPPPANVPETQTGSANGAGGHHRNFSWEAGLVGPAGTPPSTTAPLVEQKALGSDMANLGILVAELPAPVPEPLQLSPGSRGGHSTADLKAGSAPEVNQTATETAPQQFSKTASLLPELAANRAVDTPSPISVLSEKHGGAKRLSLAEEKILFQDSPSLLSPSPPLELHPALADDHQLPEVVVPAPLSPRKDTVSVFPFRSIMDLPTPAERMKHYSQARLQVSVIETGLTEWLEAMMARHPEHADAGFSYPAAAAPNTQQSSQGLGMQLPHASTIHLPPLPSLGALGHSSNQMGTKSKELLMAAGKAGKGFGKGLLSKGRNKLRGTGDKVFSS